MHVMVGRLLIEFVEDPSSPNWKGYFLAGLVLVTKSVSAFSHRQVHGTYNLKIGARIKAALTSAIYKKVNIWLNKSKFVNENEINKNFSHMYAFCCIFLDRYITDIFKINNNYKQFYVKQSVSKMKSQML